MKTFYLDPIAGISGDMFLGLLIDLGLPLEEIHSALSALPISGWNLLAEREQRQGISGTRVQVICEETHHHRTWRTIDEMLAQSALATPARELARRIFQRIGRAEAKVHGIPLDQVHFHEVGALDSIIDIVGAAVGLNALGVDQVICAPLPLSHGFVQCAHGTFPLPAPATVEILQGAPVVDARCSFELVTPTGAAIAAEIARFAPLPDMLLERCGYGVGSRRLDDRPNLLRGLLGQAASGAAQSDEIDVLECHLDDSNPEWLGALMDDLFTAGALDVAYAPLQMKKNRPGIRVTVIAEQERSNALSDLLLLQSSAIGVRRYSARRSKLARESLAVPTELGTAQVKVLRRNGKIVRISAEFDSCRELARRSLRPLPEVYRLVERAAEDFVQNRKDQ